MATVTVNLTGYTTLFDPPNDRIVWPDNVILGSTFDLSGGNQTLSAVQLDGVGSNLPGRFVISIAGTTNNRFTTAFEATGRIIVTASDGETLEVMIANADMTEPYSWIPANSAEVIAFVNHVRSLSDHNATLTLTDDPPAVAPSFADDTGDAQAWTQNTPIASITVPEASGNPTPTYAVVGSLPSGINFNTGTRVLSGTPTGATSGTIRIRASNSQGDDDWTVAYSTTAVAPDLVVSTPAQSPSGDLTPDQSFTLSAVVTNNGNGNSASTTLRWRSSTNNFISTGDPQFGTDLVSSLSPSGTSEESIVLSAPSTPGTYYYGATVDTVAGESDTNNNASGAVTVVVVEALTTPSFADDTGDAQAWTQNTPIASITVPEASGNPTPTYAVVGSLPSGINFNTGTRVLSGTPTGATSGTIRIRASNSQGDDDWTVAYSTTAVAPDLVVSTPAQSPSGDLTPDQSFTLSAVVTNNGNGNSASTTLRWRSSTNNFISTGDPQFGTDLVSSLSPSGTSEESIVLSAPSTPGTYYYGATVDTVAGESDTNNNASGAVTVVVVEALTTPSFADDTGDAQAWTQNTPIASINVPAASGTPTPTYAAVGNLPSGIAFDTATRVISGTPSAVSSGTITIRASNSEGNDDWTVGYTVAADLMPSLPDIADRTYTTGQSVNQVLSAATSGDAPLTYTLTGNPSWLSFDASTRVISGIAPDLAQASVTLTYTVEDANGDTATKMFGITVSSAPVQLPDAVAPSITIEAVGTVAEDDTQALTANVAGGTYDSLSYDWTVVSGGGSIVGNGLNAVYTPPDVTADRMVTVRVTATARGDGTTAEDNTSATSSDDEAFTVTPVEVPEPVVTKEVNSQEVIFNDVRFPIVGVVARRNANLYPGKVVIGDVREDSRPDSSIVAWSSFIGGIGVNRLRGESFVDRLRWSSLELSFDGHLVLPPRSDAVPRPTGAGTFRAFEALGNALYGVFGSSVYRYNGASWTASLHTFPGTFHSIAHITLEGEDYLVIAHSAGVSYTDNGDNWL